MLALAKIERLPRGIEGVKGKRQPSCVVSNGRKVERGGVVERDRFHIVEPTENKNKIKPYHAAFTAFNAAPAEKRRSVYGILTHVSEDDAFWYERKAQQLPVSFYKTLGWFKGGRENQQTVAHPNRLPACCGGSLDEKDGKTKARRWFGPGPDDFKFIECPGSQCEFAMRKNDDDKPPCGPSLDFMFQLIWKGEFSNLPSVTARYTSHGWDTLEYFIGFFKEISTAVMALGISEPVLYGFPFMMSLAEKTKPSKRWNWPIVTITPMISPLEFFYAQIEKRKQLKDMAAQIPAVVTIREEMEIRPTVYLMDEAGPLSIGKRNGNETVIDVEMEPEGEKPSVAPAEQRSGNTGKSSKNGSASQDGAILREINGSNGHTEYFPSNWVVEREKKLKGIGKWRDIAAETLGNNILLKTKTDKESAWELYWRIAAAKSAFEKIGAIDVWSGLTYGGDLNLIPLTPMKDDDEKVCIASVVAKLETRYRELKKGKAA